MVRSDIAQFERSAAERDGTVGVDGLVWKRRVRILQHFQPLLGTFVRHNGSAGILERLSALAGKGAPDQALLRRYGRRSEISSPSQPCEDLSNDSF
jgi:hypothetical protein